MNKTVDSRIGSRLKDRDTLIGSSPRAARKLGIRLHARTTSAAGSSVSFADGTSVDVRTVIWATGFGVDHTWIDAPIFDDHGRLIQQRGVTPSPGLYFLGLPWQHTRGSALLGWVRRRPHRTCPSKRTRRPLTPAPYPGAAPRAWLLPRNRLATTARVIYGRLLGLGPLVQRPGPAVKDSRDSVPEPCPPSTAATTEQVSRRLRGGSPLLASCATGRDAGHLGVVSDRSRALLFRARRSRC